MQRFVADIRHPKIKNHFDTVLQNAMISALKYERAISIMYDLSGIRKQDVELVLTDIDTLSRQYSLFKQDVYKRQALLGAPESAFLFKLL